VPDLRLPQGIQIHNRPHHSRTRASRPLLSARVCQFHPILASARPLWLIHDG
jgi:hypothetical protein